MSARNGRAVDPQRAPGSESSRGPFFVGYAPGMKTRALVAMWGLYCIGCSGGDGAVDGTTGPATAGTPAPMGDAAIVGVVTFEGAVPAESPADAVKGFAGCLGPDGKSNYIPTVLAAGGKLANAFVYV